MRPDREFKVRPVPVTDPGALLASLKDVGPLAWVHRGDGLVGWGEAATIILPAGPDRFAVAERSLRDLFEAAQTEDDVGLPGCGPVAFGSFTFDAARGGSVLILPRKVLGRRAGTAWMTSITPVGRGPASRELPSEVPPARLRSHSGSLTGPQWERAVG